MPDETERTEPDASPEVEAQGAYGVRRQFRALAAMKPGQMRSRLSALMRTGRPTGAPDSGPRSHTSRSSPSRRCSSW